MLEATQYLKDMACFDDYLGLKGITANPLSGLFINDLPGINFAKADAVRDSDYATGIDFINEKIDHSVALVADDLKHFMAPYFKFHSQIDHVLTDKYDDGYHTATAANRGLKVEKKASRLSKLYVNRVKVLANSSGAYNLVIADGNETETFAVTLVAGEEQWVECNYTANRDIIYIYIDNTNLKPANGKVKSRACSSCGRRYKMMKVWGWNGTKTVASHYGLRADMSVICSDDDMACILRDRIKWPVLYKFGVEFMKEVQETDRLNYFTLVGREQAAELQEKFEAEYTRRFDKLCQTLPRFLRSVDLDCVDCNSAKFIQTTA